MAAQAGQKSTKYAVSAIPDYEDLHPSTGESYEFDPHDIDRLPLYTEDNFSSSANIIELAAALQEEGQSLPIFSYSDARDNGPDNIKHGEQRRQVVDAYFNTINNGNVELVASFWGSNLVTTETTNVNGQTPLIVAVGAGHTHMVKYLLDVGASIDTFGITATELVGPIWHGKVHEPAIHRTPLQFAAETGNLAIVKLLMERGADDSLIAPDGQLALRLAANKGHREIVEFLPLRRGGGLRRWKAKHAKAMRRCKKAARGIYQFGRFFIWELPKFFLWSVPKHVIVRPLVKGMKWIHQHRKEIPKMLVDAAKGLAVGLKKIGRWSWEHLKDFPRAFWDFLKECGKFIWNSIKRLPHGLKLALVWLWTGFKNTGLAIAHIFGRFFSFIHTVCAAIGSFFQRITLRDVMNALVTLLRAIFIGAPKKIWEWICSFGDVSLKVLKAIFGSLGECIWMIIPCCISVVTYVPLKIWEMLLACASSIRSGGKEVMVWINPKRV